MARTPVKKTTKKTLSSPKKTQKRTVAKQVSTVPRLNYWLLIPFVLIFAVLGGLFVLRSMAVDPSTSDTWKLHWSDEFGGTKLDTNRWKAYHNTYGDGNHEEACLTPSNVSVSNGTLKITAKKETITCPGAKQDQFSSGFIGSRESINKNYYPVFARYEIRARVPHGQGLWPAFWLRHVNGSSTAEIDVMEYFHTQVPGRVQQTLHLPAEEKYNLAKGNMAFETPVTGTGGWHTYRVDIDPVDNGQKAKLTFYIDGVKHFDFTPSKFGWLNNYDKNAMFDIAINMAVGGDWNGHPDDHRGWSRYLKKCISKYPYKLSMPCENNQVLSPNFPAVYEVDYVRVYQRDSKAGKTEKRPEDFPIVTPEALTTTSGDSSVLLDWKDTTDTRVTHYPVRYIRSDATNKTDGKAWVYPGRIVDSRQNITGLTNGVTYDFQVRSISDRGTSSSDDDWRSEYTSVVKATPYKKN